ncbi:hypothetical protein H7J93_14690 [Mycobacterium barrassiae]|uniref:hypothetical protein n=1 Tax=Mycobacterium barrassiae TaxID=319709 RepID=UPI002265CCBD|nr:hypothetical protein [Mycobacterium barrassiae]MCV7300871.1 hypothetical protein [Mycobacterium barrassiae]
MTDEPSETATDGRPPEQIIDIDQIPTSSAHAFTPLKGVRQYFAAQHLWAARLMAHLCREREEQLLAEVAHGAKRRVDKHLQSLALGAVMESVAMLEAVVNEIWQDAAETEPIVASERLQGLSSDARALMRDLRTQRVERSLKLMEKYAVLLTCAGKPPLDRSRRPYSDVKALIKLRNALVHFTPETQWDNQVHDLEAEMKYLVPENPLLHGSRPWFPQQPLCAGGARWAWESSMKFADDWHTQMGLERSYRYGVIDWPDGLN